MRRVKMPQYSNMFSPHPSLYINLWHGELVDRLIFSSERGSRSTVERLILNNPRHWRALETFLYAKGMAL